MAMISDQKNMIMFFFLNLMKHNQIVYTWIFRQSQNLT